MVRTLPPTPPRRLTPAPRTPEPEEVEDRDTAAAPKVPNFRARFIQLAESRTSAVIAALDYLGQLSHRARYRYTDAEVDTIEEAIFAKLTETIDAFRRGQGNKPGFKFGASSGGSNAEE